MAEKPKKRLVPNRLFAGVSIYTFSVTFCFQANLDFFASNAEFYLKQKPSLYPHQVKYVLVLEHKRKTVISLFRQWLQILKKIHAKDFV